MKKIILSVLVSAALCGCASKKAKTDGSENGGVKVSSEPMSFDTTGSDSGKIDGLQSIHFDFDRASLNSNQKEILLKDAEWLKKNPQTNLQVEGHCDNTGSIEYNLSLGERRAKAAYDFLVKQGIEANRLSTVSYGKEKPFTTDDSAEAQAKNRRDNFVPQKVK